MGEHSGQSQGYTLDEALMATGFGKFQLYVLAYAGLGYAAAAIETMILSFIGESVKSDWNLSSTQESLLSSVIFGGILIGAYISGYITDNYGRRKGMLSVGILISVAGLLTSLAPNYICLVILRCLVGVGIGGASVYLSWFLEFVPATNRGTWMVISTTFNTVGTIFEASLAWIILPRFGWRWLLALSSIPAFATLIFYHLIPESPRYLCTKGRTVDAQRILKRVASVNQTKLPSAGNLISDNEITSFDEDESTSSSIENPLVLSPKSNVSKSGFSSTFGMLFSSSLIRTTLLLWVVFFGNNFAYYGIILLTSKLSNGQTDCSSTLPTNPDNSQDSGYMGILVDSFAELPAIALAALIIDRIGRKFSLGIMYMFGFIFLLPLLLLQNQISTTISLFGARLFISGSYTIANVYAPEIYPTSVRATGVGFAGAIGGIGGMICPLVAVGLLNDCHQSLAFILFEFVIFLSAVCVLFIPVETSGQDLSDNIHSIITLPRFGWRWLLALSSIPAFATLIFYHLIPESPRYLCTKGRTIDAHRILKRVASVNQTELPSAGILISDNHITSFDKNESTSSSIEDPLLLSPKSHDSKSRFSSTFGMLFSSSLIRITLLLWVVFFGNNFAYYGIILLTSKLSISQTHFITLKTMHPNNSQDSGYMTILVDSFAELPGIVLSALIIDRIGRKFSLGVMYMFGFIFLLPLLLLQNQISTTISLFGARLFINGAYTVANVYAPEIYPTSVRATGVGFAGAIGGIGGMICPLVAVGLLNDCHQSLAFILFEFVILLSGLCILFIPVETSGQDLSDNIHFVY